MKSHNIAIGEVLAAAECDASDLDGGATRSAVLNIGMRMRRNLAALRALLTWRKEPPTLAELSGPRGHFERWWFKGQLYVKSDANCFLVDEAKMVLVTAQPDGEVWVSIGGAAYPVSETRGEWCPIAEPQPVAGRRF